MNTQRIINLICIMLLFVSCEKELDFQYHDVESQLVIEGQTSATGTLVKLTRTCPMNEPMDNNTLTDAEIFLTDLTLSQQHKLNINSDGLFYDETPGIDGHEYQLEIRRNGRRYASSSTMKPATEIVDLEFQWIKMPYDYVAVLKISFYDLESENDCYWIRIYRNNEPYKWLLSDDRSAVNGIISEVTMTSRQDLDEEDEKDILRDGDEVTVAVVPISLDMYDYLVAIQADSNGPRLFSGDFCLGYYIASTQTQKTIINNPDSMTEYK